MNTPTYYVDSSMISHVGDRAAIDAILTAHGAGAPDTRPYSGGQRGFSAAATRDAAQAAILVAFPRPTFRAGLSLDAAAITSGERPGDY